MKALDKILTDIDHLSLDDKEVIIDIVKKRTIEEKRDMLYEDYIQAKKDFKKGNIKRGSASDLLKDIKND